MAEKSEIAKWAEVSEDAGVIEEFVHWLEDERNSVICERGEFGFQPSGQGTQALLFKFFEIDGGQLEAERREELQRAQSKARAMECVGLSACGGPCDGCPAND